MANTNGKITKQENEAIQNFHNEFLTSDKLINLKSDLNEDPILSTVSILFTFYSKSAKLNIRITAP